MKLLKSVFRIYTDTAVKNNSMYFTIIQVIKKNKDNHLLFRPTYSIKRRTMVKTKVIKFQKHLTMLGFITGFHVFEKFNLPLRGDIRKKIGQQCCTMSKQRQKSYNVIQLAVADFFHFVQLHSLIAIIGACHLVIHLFGYTVEAGIDYLLLGQTRL